MELRPTINAESLLKRIGLLLSIAFISLPALSQPEHTDFLRNTGKIYTVVIVLIIIFLGIILYLVRLEKKINKLENEHKTNK